MTAENGNGLTDKQRAFAIEYCKDFNGTQAAKRAGYRGNNNVLAVAASRLLRNANVRARVEARLESAAMSADEVLWRLGQHARGNLADFIDTDVPGGLIDMDTVAAKGHLLKKLSWTKSGLQVELYDAQAALEKLGKAHGLFVHRIKHTGAGDDGEITYIFKSNIDMDKM